MMSSQRIVTAGMIMVTAAPYAHATDIDTTIVLTTPDVSLDEVRPGTRLDFAVFAQPMNLSGGATGLGAFNLAVNIDADTPGAASRVSAVAINADAWPVTLALAPDDVVGAVEPPSVVEDLGAGSPLDEPGLGIRLFEFAIVAAFNAPRTDVTVSVEPGDNAGSTGGFAVVDGAPASVMLRGVGATDISFDALTFSIVPIACNVADLAAPFGLLDGADVNAFITAFGGANEAADLNDDGIIDGADVNAFISAFGAGCP